ncbi:hypothetical protein MRX96_011190 [Rhipicephalus microplus]
MNCLRSLGKAFAQMTIHAAKPSRSLSFCATTAWQASLPTPYARKSTENTPVTLPIQRPSLPSVQPVRHRFFVRFKGSPPPRRPHLRPDPGKSPRWRHPAAQEEAPPPAGQQAFHEGRRHQDTHQEAQETEFGQPQEHSVVLVYKSRTKDVPGLKLKVVRGKYDCAHVIRKPQSGS